MQYICIYIAQTKNLNDTQSSPMTDGFKKALTEMVGPILRRPKRFQVGALC